MLLLIRAAVIAVFALALTAGARETFTREELDALESERRTAEAELQRLKSEGRTLTSDAEDLTGELIAAALQTRKHESSLAQAKTSLSEIAAALKEKRGSLFSNQAAFEELLSALAASHRRRPPALIVSPGQANQAIRRAVLMRAVSPRLEARTDLLRKDIAALTKLDAAMQAETLRLETAEAQLALKSAEIELLSSAKLARARAVGSDLAGLAERAARLGAEAKTLRELLEALEARAPEAPSFKPARGARAPQLQPVALPPSRLGEGPARPRPKPLGEAALGALQKPVTGTLRNRFGDALSAGGKAEWISWTTASDAQVTAPAGGVVEYSRPFRSYGSMLILRTSDDYRVILTGMSRVYVSEGQSVRAGEPVGRMPERLDPAPELTMELRLGDKVRNPAEWLGTD